MSDDEFAALMAPLASELAGSAVSAQQVGPSDYLYNKLRFSVEWDADPTLPSQEIQSNRCKRLAVSVRALEFA